MEKTNMIIGSFEKAVEELVDVFNTKHNDYFFTEKEIHSYFYHLCLSKNLIYGSYNLVHTEYPTPFKCETLKKEPYIKKAKGESKNQRAHIDLVLLNPKYLDYVLEKRKDDYFKYISSIGGALFSNYINDFYSLYKDFAEKTGESILLYAIEFKYHRHSYSGEKYPAMYLKQDINKLKLINEFMISSNVPYCKKIKSLVFIGDRISDVSKNSLRQISIYSNGICSIYEK